MANTFYTPQVTDFNPKKYGKASVAEEAVKAMGVSDMIVEMARAYQFQEHGTEVENASQLFMLAEELLSNPQKQYQVGKKMSAAAAAATEMKAHFDNVAVPEHVALVKAEAAEMQWSPKPAMIKAPPAPTTTAPDSQAQLKKKVERLALENHRLRQRKTCRKCKKVELATSGVTFLPCGHFITCEGCSETFDDCPACGKSIMGTVRTFLS